MGTADMPMAVRRWTQTGPLPLFVVLALTLASSARAASAIEPPKRVGDTAVPYPAAGVGEASVTLVVVVDAEGAVTDVRVKQGDSPFAEVATDSVRTWRFKPASRDGAPVASRITVVVDFHPAAGAPPPTPTPIPNATPGSPAAAPLAAASHDERAGADEVTMRGAREEHDTIHIPRSEARFIPGAFGDPFRVIEALPGMTPWRSGLPYYYVRGSAPESVGYAIDGIRVPLLFHTGAGPSVIAPALVESVDLFPAAYPARYGRSTGAIVAGETTPPETDRTRAEFGVRLFDANAFGETPYDDGKGSVMAAARYGYTGLLTSVFAPDWSLNYWDYQARASHRAWGADTVSLFVFGAHDDGAYQGRTLFHVEYHRADLRYDHPLPGGNLRVAATLSTDDAFTASPNYGYSATLSGPGGRLRTEIEERLSPEILARTGADFGATHFDVDTPRAPHTDVEGGVYGDLVWRPSSRVEVVPGVRLDAYEARGDTGVAPQPRVTSRIRIAPGIALISAAGMAHQEPTENVLVPDKPPDILDSLPRDAYQYSEALEARLPASLRVRVTGFYTRVTARSGGLEEQNEGLEVFAQRDFTERLGGFVAYSLSRSEGTVGGANVGILGSSYRPETSSWDRTHVLSTVLSYDLGRGWRAGVRFFFESGRPYEVTCPTVGCAAMPAPIAGTVAQGRLPDFYRLDVRVEKRWTFADGKWLAATVEAFNALRQSEPIEATYLSSQGLTVVNLTPLFLPSLGLEGGL